MQLLIVTREHANDQYYGLGRAMRRISSYLSTRGHQVIYCSAADWTEAEHESFERTQARWRKIFINLGLNCELLAPWAERLVQASVARKFARDCCATHIWFHDPWLAAAFHWGGVFGLKVRPHIRWGVSEHGLGSFVQAVGLDGLVMNLRTFRLFTWLERRVLKRAHWVFTPSSSAMNALCRDFGRMTPAKSWHLLGYGAPNPITESRDSARAALGWTDDTVNIIAVGRISPVKRMHVLVEACALAQKNLNKKIRLFILGDGDLTLIDQSSETTGFYPVVRFSNDIHTYLAAADVYLSACQAESFGLANQEAVAAGLPSIIACGGAACEVVGQGAWLVDGSIDSFVEALSALLSEPVLYQYWKTRAENASWPSWESIINDCEYKLQSNI